MGATSCLFFVSPVVVGPQPLLVLAASPSVRAITAALETEAIAYRTAQHVAYVRDALDTPALPASSPFVMAFKSAMAAAWRLRVDNNRVKEPLWRLAVDAFPGACFRCWTCPCGRASASSRGRRHVFWDRPVAQAVRAQLARQDLPGGPAPAAERADVWLLRPPASYAGARRRWFFVAMAAIAAMEFGRCVLWARSIAGGGDAVGDVVVPSGRRHLAAERFWVLLGDMPHL